MQPEDRRAKQPDEANRGAGWVGESAQVKEPKQSDLGSNIF